MRQDGDRHCASALDHRRDGSSGRARARADRRGRDAQSTARPRRTLCAALGRQSGGFSTPPDGLRRRDALGTENRRRPTRQHRVSRPCGRAGTSLRRPSHLNERLPQRTKCLRHSRFVDGRIAEGQGPRPAVCVWRKCIESGEIFMPRRRAAEAMATSLRPGATRRRTDSSIGRTQRHPFSEFALGVSGMPVGALRRSGAYA